MQISFVYLHILFTQHKLIKMKKELTDKQQSIIEDITNEFIKINENKKQRKSGGLLNLEEFIYEKEDDMEERTFIASFNNAKFKETLSIVDEAIETLNAQPYAGKTITFSGYFQSSVTPTVGLGVDYATTVDATITGGTWTNITASSGGSGTAGASSFTRITGTYAIPSNAKSIRVYFNANLSNTNILYVGAIQTELGSVPTAFSRAGGTLQGELSAAQRYYWRYTTSGGFSGVGGNGLTTSTTNASIQIPNPVAMRTYPSSIDVGTLRFIDTANSAYNITAASLLGTSSYSTNCTLSDFNVTISGATSGRYGFLQAQGSGGYIGFSAEL